LALPNPETAFFSVWTFMASVREKEKVATRETLQPRVAEKFISFLKVSFLLTFDEFVIEDPLKLGQACN
jgi:hypothetical protein